MFATSWVSATVSQFCAQIAATIVCCVVYFDKVTSLEFVLSMFAFNIGLVIGPIWYREIDWFEKNLVFFNWQIDEELRNWKTIVNSLPVGVLLVRDGKVKYTNETARELFQVAESSSRDRSQCGLRSVTDFTSRADRSFGQEESSDSDEERKQADVSSEVEKRLRQVTRGSDHGTTLYSTLFGGSEAIESAGEKFYYVPQQTRQQSSPENIIAQRMSNTTLGTSSAATVLGVSTTKLDFLGNETAEVVVIQDLSIYEQLDEEKAYRQYQKVFFAMITHELRNPLQGILGILELLKSMQTGEESAKQCVVGLNTGKLMLCLIQDMLDLSQLEANKFSLNDDEVFSPADIVGECVDVMEFQYSRKGIALVKKTQCDRGLQVQNDKNRYKQIIFNLLGNALKFTKVGHVDITISYSDRVLSTSVADTGVGIQQEDQARLFQMYGKMDLNRRDNPSGVGFGLNICKRLSEAMGGGISVRSKLGSGSEFIFTIRDFSPAKEGSSGEDSSNQNLPTIVAPPDALLCKGRREKKLCDEEDKAEAPSEIVVGPSPKPACRRRVLVVDDENVCSYVIKDLVKSLGFDADTVWIF